MLPLSSLLPLSSEPADIDVAEILSQFEDVFSGEWVNVLLHITHGSSNAYGTRYYRESLSASSITK